MRPSERYERQLRVWWVRLNQAVFGGALLVPPRLLVDRALEVDSLWEPAQLTIRFSHRFVRSSSWWTVVESLKREMARQYAADVIGARDESEGRKLHQMLSERFGLCDPPTRDAGDGLSDAQLQEVRALLARGDATSDRSALSRARVLMRSATPVMECAEAFTAVAVGPVSTAVSPHEARGATILYRLLGVECLWVDSLDPGGLEGRQLEVLGRLRQVEAAERLRALMLEEAGHRWTERSSDRTGGWLEFLNRVFVGFEQACSADSGTVETERPPDVGLVELSLRRRRWRSNLDEPRDG